MSGAAGALTIRPAHSDETATLRTIARAAYSKYVPRIGREPAPMNANFAAHVAAGHALVIESSGSILGYMIAWPRDDEYLIDNLAVDPRHQGQGLGRRLLEYAMAQARRNNLSALRLYTNAAMTENLAIYRRVGFVETHRGVENGYARVHMRLALNADPH